MDSVECRAGEKLEAAGGGLRDAFAHADAGKALSFSAAGPATADGCACRVCKRAICDCSNAQDSNRDVDAAGNLVNVV